MDEDPIPQMRNIQYDLSPERMERVWARYKSRWERVEEVERERELERRKEEFRRRVDEKRERMGSMSVEEREDFLFKLRQWEAITNCSIGFFFRKRCLLCSQI